MIEQSLPTSIDVTLEQTPQSASFQGSNLKSGVQELGTKALRRSSASRRKPLLVCFSHLRWEFVWQRPQHLLTRAAAHFEVVFVEEPVFIADARPRLSLSNKDDGVCVATPCLPFDSGSLAAVVAQRDLIRSLLANRRGRQTIFWYYTPMALSFTEGLSRDVTVYDNMDELSVFKGASPEMLSREDDLFQQADIVFTGGMSLYEAKRSRHSNLHCFPSSVDVAHFARTRVLSRTREARSQNSVSIGFFGVIDERLDMDLVAKVAALRPGWQIEMVGPVAKIDPSELVRGPNLHWLGACSYADLPDKLAQWDVGLMPFAINEATRFISPTKTPEFLAAGLPVVSTEIVDVVRTYGQQGLVEIAATPKLFVSAIERLLSRPRKPWLDAVDRHLSTMSWDATWAAMQALIAEGSSRRLSERRKAGSDIWTGKALPAVESSLNESAAESV